MSIPKGRNSSKTSSSSSLLSLQQCLMLNTANTTSTDRLQPQPQRDLFAFPLPTSLTTTNTATAMDYLDLNALHQLSTTRNEQLQQQIQVQVQAEQEQEPSHDSNHVKHERRLSTGTCSTDTDSTSGSTSTSSTASNRRVQFDLTMTTTLYVQRAFETDEEKASLWYSKADIQATTTAEKECVQKYMTDTPTYLTQLLQIWRTPCMDTQVLDKLVQPIHNTEMRGLEKHCLKAMKQRRGIVLRKVLQAQQDAVWMAEDPNDPHERAELLRGECEPLSRTSGRFAKALAQGDAMAVQ